MCEIVGCKSVLAANEGSGDEEGFGANVLGCEEPGFHFDEAEN